MLLIFIGYVFVFFNFPYNGFDLLADFIGYIIIYLGLSKLPQEINFVNAKPYTLFLAVLNFIYSIGGQWIPSVLLIGMGLINMALSLYILFMFNGGIKEIERCSHTYLKADKLSSTWRLILIFTVGNGVITLIPIEMLSITATMFGMAATFMQVVYLFHLIGVKEAMDQMGQEK